MTPYLRSRDVLIALSLANLWLIRLWTTLFGTHNDYYYDSPAGFLWVAVTWCGTLLLACVFLALNSLLRTLESRIRAPHLRHFVFLLAMTIPANGIRQQIQYLAFGEVSFGEAIRMLGAPGLLLGGAMLLLLGYGTIRAGSVARVARGGSAVILALFPFFLVTTAHVLLAGLQSAPDQGFSTKPLEPMTREPRPALRVVLVVFDGLDFDLPSGATEFERLISSSVNWDNAYPRTNRTIEGLPSLISGLPITHARPIAPNRLFLKAEGDPTGFGWGLAENLFTKARAYGANSALVGWYHPYCRVLNGLSSCESFGYAPRADALRGILRDQASLLANTLPFAYRTGLVGAIGETRFDPDIINPWHAQQFERIHTRSQAAAENPDFDLVFLHYPVPHPPFIAGRINGSRLPVDNYQGNVLLADQALGDLRQRVESAGLAARTVFLVTADHWNRADTEAARSIRSRIGDLHQRVPLIAHFPGQEAPVLLEGPTQNVAAHYLALAILAGSLQGPGDLPAATEHWPAWITGRD